VLVDRASGWVELKAVIFRHGVPRALISDRGGAFVSRLLSNLALRLGFKQQLTTAYNPAANGLVERKNAFIKKLLRSYCAETKSSWAQGLSAVAFAIRTAPREGIDFTPAYLVYGRELRLPLEALLPDFRERQIMTGDEWVTKRIAALRRIIHVAHGEGRNYFCISLVHM